MPGPAMSVALRAGVSRICSFFSPTMSESRSRWMPSSRHFWNWPTREVALVVKLLR